MTCQKFLCKPSSLILYVTSGLPNDRRCYATTSCKRTSQARKQHKWRAIWWYTTPVFSFLFNSFFVFGNWVGLFHKTAAISLTGFWNWAHYATFGNASVTECCLTGAFRSCFGHETTHLHFLCYAIDESNPKGKHFGGRLEMPTVRILAAFCQNMNAMLSCCFILGIPFVCTCHLSPYLFMMCSMVYAMYVGLRMLYPELGSY